MYKRQSYLINPYGMHFSEVTASSLIKIDIDGNKVDACLLYTSRCV